jgi:hypothetical protein
MAKDHVDTNNFGNSLFRISFPPLLKVFSFFGFERDSKTALPAGVVSIYAKNMPGMQIKLQARKYRKIAGDWRLAASGLAECSGEMTRSVWAYAQIFSWGGRLKCGSAGTDHLCWHELYLAQMAGGW